LRSARRLTDRGRARDTVLWTGRVPAFGRRLRWATRSPTHRGARRHPARRGCPGWRAAGSARDLHGLTPRQVRSESFTLPAAQDVQIEAIGAESAKISDRFSWVTTMWQRDARRAVPPWSGNAWILDVSNRKVVWELSASTTGPGARGAREFKGSIPPTNGTGPRRPTAGTVGSPCWRRGAHSIAALSRPTTRRSIPRSWRSSRGSATTIRGGSVSPRDRERRAHLRRRREQRPRHGRLRMD
jgi:hypothetical protein